MSNSSLSPPYPGKFIGPKEPKSYYDLSKVIGYDATNSFYYSVTSTGIDYISYVVNRGRTWDFFNSPEEYREYADAYFRKKAAAEEEERRAKVSESEAIFAEVAAHNAVVFSTFGEAATPSTFRLTAKGDPFRTNPSPLRDPFNWKILRMLMVTANTPSDALAYARELVSEGGRLFDCAESRHLWIDPRYVLVEHIGSSKTEGRGFLCADTKSFSE